MRNTRTSRIIRRTEKEIEEVEDEAGVEEVMNEEVFEAAAAAVPTTATLSSVFSVLMLSLEIN